MQKTANILLILSAEERQETEKFITRCLKTLDPERVADLQSLTQLGKQQVRRLQLDKSHHARSTNRTSQLMAKLHDTALAGMNGLIKETNQAGINIQQKMLKKQKDKANGSESDAETQKLDELILTVDPDEMRHAADFVQDKLADLRVPELKVFRDACQEMLTWWESDKGQIDSLHLDQHGNVNTAAGRLTIRQKRDELQKEIFNPFKTFFRELNITFQRAFKEASDKARQMAQKQKAEAGREAAKV